MKKLMKRDQGVAENPLTILIGEDTEMTMGEIGTVIEEETGMIGTGSIYLGTGRMNQVTGQEEDHPNTMIDEDVQVGRGREMKTTMMRRVQAGGGREM